MAKSGLASRMNSANLPPGVAGRVEPYYEPPVRMECGQVPKKKKKKEKVLYTSVAPSERIQEPEEEFSYDEFEQELEAEAINIKQKTKTAQAARKGASTVSKVLIIILSLYACFVIFGLISTDYVYDSNGQIVPEILSVSDLAILSEYDTLSAFYLRARIIYEDTLKLDYRLSQEPDNSLMIAMEYTALLEKVDKLIVDLSAAEYSSKYTAIYSQINQWATTDIALYLQYMAKAITNNDADAAGNAVLTRDIVYQDFAQLTSNIAKLADSTKGVKNIDLYTWTPDNFIADLSEEG